MDPIAIIGMGCRFPQASGPDAFWELLRNGVDAISEVPASRWDASAFYNSDPQVRGKTNSRWGGFLGPVDQFDAKFFRISPREATQMDPQQRLLLEVAWEALEDAAQPAEDLVGSQTGVFIGAMNNEYRWITEADPGLIDTYTGSGNGLSLVANRLSYTLGLCGPSIATDTACSSSLVAAHLACVSLCRGECDLALAGGTNLALSPWMHVSMSKLGLMSPDGRCKAFDARADGIVRGEGVGVVVLKPLAKAVADGDVIYAVIRGSAVNHDGRSNGLMAPNRWAQESVLRAAYQQAGVSPGQVQYVETHGTGTSLGDPIEVAALGAVLAADRPAGESCTMGSVKTNCGHLEAAAGIAGLIKVALSLKHGLIPPSLHYKEPNPFIPFKKLPLRVQTDLSPWPERPSPALAGVSAFGLGGTNAHVVLEEAPVRKPVPLAVERPLHILALSARGETALRDLAGRYAAYLRANPAASLVDVCFSADTGRTHFEHRLAVVAGSTDSLREQLSAFAAGSSDTGLMGSRMPGAARPKIAFLFTGQGAQYVGMGRELYETQPGFRKTLNRCAEILDPLLDRPLLSLLYPESGASSPLDETIYTQPALFALEYALAQLWMSWGVSPMIVMGHSVGEYVAACVAGVFSLEDGLRLTAERGRLMNALPRDGEMAVVFASEERVSEALRGYTSQVSIAAINGPAGVVISGDQDAVQHVLTALEAEGVGTRRLTISHASHSPLMEPMLADFERVAQQVRYSPPRIDLVSNVTGTLVAEEIGTGDHWRRHIMQPVRFSAGIETLRQAGVDLFIEMGPKPILLGMGRRCLPENQGAWLPSLRPRRGDWEQLLDSLAKVYVLGCDVDWPGFEEDYAHGRRRLGLPTYPFQRERYWVDPPQTLPSPVGDCVYEIEWQPRAASGRRHLAAAMPVPEEISHLPRSISQDLEEYRTVLGQLEGLSIAYVVSALRRLGWVFRPDRRFSTAEMAEQLGVIDEHRQLLGRSLEMLAEEGLLRQADGQWEVVSEPQVRDPQEWMSALLARHAVAQAELTMLERCGTQLAQLMRGECDGLQLLFPGGDLTVATRLYQDSPGARVMNTLVQKVVTAELLNLPQEGGVRILEIGAGTGGTTAHVLPHLPDERVEYVFSDVSPAFIAQAQDKLGSHSCVHYRVLDIEQPLETQEIGRQRFDLVIAANVLHATRDLRQSLQHVRQVLAPGGMVILLEGTTPSRWVDLIFGMTKGWWRFADRDLRPSHPLISAGQWENLLRESGFEQCVTISPDRGAKIGLRQAVIVARAAEDEPGQAQLPQQTWLILADSGGVGERLGELLQARGQMSLLVFPGDAYEQVAERAFKIALANPDHFRQVLDVVETQHPPLRGVVHLWSLDAADTSLLTQEKLEDAVQRGCGSTLHLLQALAEMEPAAPPSLWLVTQGAQPVGGGQVAVAQSPLWGLGRVAALEHPEIWGGMVDLDLGATDEAAKALWAEIWPPGRRDQEDHVAFRDGQRFAARLVSAGCPEVAGVRFQPDGTYLITGGLGFLGLRLARWMVERGARHLALLGRRGLPDRDCWSDLAPDSDVRERVQAVQALEGMGAKVAVFQADVKDLAQMSAVFEQIEAVPFPLRGIFHAAGVAEYRAIADIDPDDLKLVFAPKVAGTWVLHQLTRDVDLDFCVYFSSAGAVWGSAGQGHYGAANHFMDAMAHYRRSIGLPALSVNWGLLVTGGLVSEEHRRWLTQIGLEELSPEQGFDTLGRLLGTDSAQKTVARVDWAKFKELYEMRRARPLLEQIEVETPSLSRQPCRQQTGAVRENTESLHPWLGRRLSLPLSQEVRFEAQYTRAYPSYLNDHRVYGTLVAAGASYISVVLSAVREAYDTVSCTLSDVCFLRPLVLSEEGKRIVQVILSPCRDERQATAAFFQLVSRRKDQDPFEPASWVEHVRGNVQLSRPESPVTDPIDIKQVQDRCPVVLPGEQFYADLWEAGYHFGPAFRWGETIWQGDRDVVCKLRLPRPTPSAGECPIHPGLIDAAWMSLAGCRDFGLSELIENGYVNVPFHIDQFKLYVLPGNERVWCYAQMRDSGQDDQEDPIGDLWLLSEAGGVIAEIRGIETRRAGRKALLRVLEQSRRAHSSPSTRAPVPKPPRQASDDLLRQLEATPVDERRVLLATHLRSQLAKVLGLNSPDQIKSRQRLFDLGMDSLMAIELKGHLESSLGQSLRTTLMFDHPTLESLTDYLAGEVIPAESSAPSSAEPECVQDEDALDSATFDALSESDVIALLDEKLEDIENLKFNRHDQ